MASGTNLARRASMVWLAGAALVLLVRPNAAAQSSFDPYNPSTGQFRENSKPIYPSNLALPGQARQAKSLDRQAVYGTRVDSTPFERFMRDGYEDIFAPRDLNGEGSRTRVGPGVPYYRSGRDSARDYVPNRDADRDFNAVRRERERRFSEAIRETDPVKRARLLRKANDPIDPTTLRGEEEAPPPSDATERNADASRREDARPGGSTFPIARNREGLMGSVGRNPERPAKPPGLDMTPPRPARPATRMPLSGEPLSGLPESSRFNPEPLGAGLPSLAPSGERYKPSSGGLTKPVQRPSLSRLRPSLGPERRPLLPSEAVDRNKKAAEARAKGSQP